MAGVSRRCEVPSALTSGGDARCQVCDAGVPTSLSPYMRSLAIPPPLRIHCIPLGETRQAHRSSIRTRPPHKALANRKVRPFRLDLARSLPNHFGLHFHHDYASFDKPDTTMYELMGSTLLAPHRSIGDKYEWFLFIIFYTVFSGFSGCPA